MKIEGFEQPEIWHDAGEWNKKICQVTSLHPFSPDFRFRDQISDAAGSVTDNMAEDFGRGGNMEFIGFLSISDSSANELKSQSYRAYDVGYIAQETLNQFIEPKIKQTKKTGNMIQFLKQAYTKASKSNNPEL